MRPVTTRAILPAILLAMLLVSCDESEAIHELDPSLGRMLKQPRANPYGATEAFEDERVMRMPVPGTVRHDLPPPTKPPLSRPLLSPAGMYRPHGVPRPPQ